MGWWLLILYGCCSFLLTLFWNHAFYDICARHIKRTNYQKRTIPTAMGVSISLALVVTTGIQPGWLLTKEDLIAAIAVLVATCVGLLDDIANDKQVKGLKGHLSMLYHEKRFTSGGLKAVTLTGSAFWIAAQLSHTWVAAVAGGVLIAMMTNAINLFDLRPGRAVKVSGCVLLSFILYRLFHQHSGLEISSWKWYVMLLAALLAFVRKDLHGVVMLGDTGANTLGILLGILSVQHLPLAGQIGMISVLIFLHVLAEMYSITTVIERIAFLRWIDRLGTTAQLSKELNQAKENEDIQELVHS